MEMCTASGYESCTHNIGDAVRIRQDTLSTWSVIYSTFFYYTRHETVEGKHFQKEKVYQKILQSDVCVAK